jgi:hypothetical protein
MVESARKKAPSENGGGWRGTAKFGGGEDMNELD